MPNLLSHFQDFLRFSWAAEEESSRGRLTRMIIEAGQRWLNACVVWRDQFSVATCDPERLEGHGLARRLPRFAGEDWEQYRRRLASALPFWRKAGTKGGIVEMFRQWYGETATIELCRDKAFIVGWSIFGGPCAGIVGGGGPAASYDIAIAREAYDPDFGDLVPEYHRVALTICSGVGDVRFIIQTSTQPIVGGFDVGGPLAVGGRSVYDSTGRNLAE